MEQNSNLGLTSAAGGWGIQEDYRYAAACVTSMGVRMTPENRMTVPGSSQSLMQATSAETNVLNGGDFYEPE